MSARVKGVAVALGLLAGSGAAAVEPPSGAFAGYWRGHLDRCGALTLAVREVRQDGTVVGTVDCPAMGIAREIGPSAIRGRQLRGWIEGRTLRLEGERATALITLDADRLVGFARIPLAGETRVVLSRQ
jgi:hypothetical protein